MSTSDLDDLPPKRSAALFDSVGFAVMLVLIGIIGLVVWGAWPTSAPAPAPPPPIKRPARPDPQPIDARRAGESVGWHAGRFGRGVVRGVVRAMREKADESKGASK